MILNFISCDAVRAASSQLLAGNQFRYTTQQTTAHRDRWSHENAATKLFHHPFVGVICLLAVIGIVTRVHPAIAHVSGSNLSFFPMAMIFTASPAAYAHHVVANYLRSQLTFAYAHVTTTLQPEANLDIRMNMKVIKSAANA